MTYELIIKADSKEELLAILQGQPHSEQPAIKTTADYSVKIGDGVHTDVVEEVKKDVPVTVTKAEEPKEPEMLGKQFKVEDVARACAPLMENPEGVKMLQELLASYNVASLVDLPKEQLNDFALKLKALGVEV